MSAVLAEIVQILVAGISRYCNSAFGQGVTSLVQAIFLTGNGTTDNPFALSTFRPVL